MKTINHSKKFALVTVAILGVAGFAAGAQADESSLGADSRTVRYADLNLNTEAGAKVLYQRIRSAAEQVCGDAGSRQLEQIVAAKACMDRAVVSSVRAVSSMQLTRTANAHGYVVETAFNVAAR